MSKTTNSNKMMFCDLINDANNSLVMTFLDDELAIEERREIELHILDCEPCRAHVDRERSELASLRHQLRAPAAPDLLRARLMQSLDAEDKSTRQRARKQAISAWLLPGFAMTAAAAALAVFIGIRPIAMTSTTTVASEAVRQQMRQAPLEVQGASTGPWVAQHFQPDLELPHFADSSADKATDTAPDSAAKTGEVLELMGARLTSLGGQNAAQLFYQLHTVDGENGRIVAFVIKDVNPEDLQGGRVQQIGGRELHVMNSYGYPAVAYVDDHHMGYVFTSPDLSRQQLVDVVGRSSLIKLVKQAGEHAR